jgi:hypothetical protein
MGGINHQKWELEPKELGYKSFNSGNIHRDGYKYYKHQKNGRWKFQADNGTLSVCI